VARAPSLRESLPDLWRTVRRFGPYVRKQRSLIGIGSTALAAEVIFRLLEPWPLKFVFDRIIQPVPGRSATGWDFADGIDPLTLLAVAAVGVAALAGLRAAASYVATVTLALAGNRVLSEVRGELYRHLQRLSLSFHSKARGGDLITRVVGDVGRLQEVAVTAALPLVTNVVTLTAMAMVMLFMNWRLALIAFSVFPVFSFAMVRLTKRIHAVSRKQRKSESALATIASEAFAAIRVVQSYSLEPALERNFTSENQRSLKDGVKAKRLSAGLERKTDVLVAISTGLVLYVGARFVLTGSLTPGDLIVFMTYLKSAFKPMRDLAKYTGRIAKAAASGERIVDVLDTAPDIVDRPGAIDVSALRGAVHFERVYFGYENDREVLRDVDLRVQPGERVALVGPSGGGKSSIGALLLRLYDPLKGSVMIDGLDVRDYSLGSLRRQIAVVLQESVLFATSVKENILYGFPEASYEDVERAARLADAHGFICELPDGYDTMLGERGATLSGGQRQRIAIARAAIRSAPILILDEPAAGLDRSSEKAVMTALDQVTASRTTLLIAHDLETARTTDRIVFLDDGRIVEMGTHDRLVARGGRYATLYSLEQRARVREHSANGGTNRVAAE
jgi:ATP-binding cassette, subfamily B, bacterial